MEATTTVQDDLTDDMDDLDDDFEDDETPEPAPAKAAKAAPKQPAPAAKLNPVARWMASKGWKHDYPRWVWWAGAGAAGVFGLGVLGAVIPDQTPEETVRVVPATVPAASPTATAAPQIDPFVGMPPRHPLVEWVLTGKYDQQVVIANQARTSRDKAGALADPCRLWVGITLRQDGSKVVQLLLADGWQPAFPVPLFIGAQCGRPEPHQFGEVTAASPLPATTTTAAPVEVAPATTIANPVQQLRSTIGAGTATTEPQPATTVAPAPMVHYATQGQGLLAVARMYGVDVAELAAVNGWTVDSPLSLGQAVVIPGRFVQ